MKPAELLQQIVFLDDAGTPRWIDWLGECPGVTVQEIGRSRADRPLYGLTIGTGSQLVSLTAGAHADEPAGPMAVCRLVAWLSGNDETAAHLRQTFTFRLCPQVNPDGAQANSPWFAPVPDPARYLRHVRRELPGDDIEFGYPRDGRPALRPENDAVAQFLARPGQPYAFHASLHSMGFADGAWFLIGQSSVERTTALRQRLAEHAAAQGFGLHDIQRNGEKGFQRIGRGFCTTPTGAAMRHHFNNAGDPATARLFHHSSMEYIQSLGGTPLVMVSEIPNFALGRSWQPAPVPVQAIDVPPPAPGSTRYEIFRDALKTRLATGDIDSALNLASEYGITPVPFDVHVNLQLDMVRSALLSL